MADKDLKSLTIGDTTFRNTFTDTTVGEHKGLASEIVNITASAWQNVATCVITEPGRYLIHAAAEFRVGSTTGVSERDVSIYIERQTGNIRGWQQDVHMANNKACQLVVSQEIVLEENQLPANVHASLWTDKACQVRATISATKMAVYPALAVVGGGNTP